MRRIFSALGILFVLSLALLGTAQADTPGPTPGGDEPPPNHERNPAAPTPTPSGGAGPQIVGGNPADPGEYPWQAAIVYREDADPFDGQYCAGTLLDAQHVLTAAHCIVLASGLYGIPVFPQPLNFGVDFDVVLGVTKLSDGPTSGGSGQRIEVDGLFAYPGFAFAGFAGLPTNDLAILRLATPATLDATVSPIDYVHPTDSSLFAPGDTATITGWGDTTGGGPYSDDLLEIEETIVSNLTCNAANDGLITAGMLCAGPADGSVGTCDGDNGGPFTVLDGGDPLLAGVVSWGYSCAIDGKYDVFTRLADYSGWLDAMLNPPTGLYLPLVAYNSGPCVPSAAGPTSNIDDARTICSGQVVTGSVHSFNDIDDVYKINVQHDQKLTLTLTGTGSGDVDLLLFSPDATDVEFDIPAAVDAINGNSESIVAYVFTSGDWFIDLYAFDGPTVNYTLTATVTSQ